jgi:adenylate kinase
LRKQKGDYIKQKYFEPDLSFLNMEYSNLKNDDIVNELYRRFRCIELNKNKRIVFLGVPGAGLKYINIFIGKGTHSFKLSQRYCLCHLATGDLLRSEVSQGTEFGKKVKNIMSEGGFVSDDLMIDLISTNLAKSY